MSIRAKVLATVSAVVFLGTFGVAKAADTKPAGQQGLTSVEKNTTKDTDKDNRGLTNAKSRIEDNMQDRAGRKAADRDDKKKKHNDADDKTKRDKVEHAAKADRPERGGRP